MATWKGKENASFLVPEMKNKGLRIDTDPREMIDFGSRMENPVTYICYCADKPYQWNLAKQTLCFL